MRITRRAQRGASGVGLFCVASLGQTAYAQVPGTPVLQNAFVAPGLALAGNLGSAGSGRGFFGAAAAWGLGSRFQLSAGAGAQRSRDVSRGAYGARAAMNVWSNGGGSFGVGAFVGVGGAARTRNDLIVTNPAVMNIPAGVSMGYKRPMGTTRGFSVFASPFYSWTRSDSGIVSQKGDIRFSGGVDVAISQSFGVTVGGEFGSGKSSTQRNAFGAAITFVPGRR